MRFSHSPVVPAAAVLIGATLFFTLGERGFVIGTLVQALIMIPWAWAMNRRPDAAFPNPGNAPFVNDMHRLWRRIGVVVLVIFAANATMFGLLCVSMLA